MSKLTRTVIAIVLLFVGMGSATAACFYNGKKYPEGTVIGDRVCSDGRRVPRR
jgi:hypothetical protein